MANQLMLMPTLWWLQHLLWQQSSQWLGDISSHCYPCSTSREYHHKLRYAQQPIQHRLEGFLKTFRYSLNCSLQPYVKVGLILFLMSSRKNLRQISLLPNLFRIFAFWMKFLIRRVLRSERLQLYYESCLVLHKQANLLSSFCSENIQFPKQG